jgi:brefeldin A-inhibited guanine nucleotide-exchange protein
MFAANDSSKSTELCLRMANIVWSLLSSVEGLDRLVVVLTARFSLTFIFVERVVNSAFEIVTRLNQDHFKAVIKNGAFADLTVCITDFCKVSKFQKISLLAIAMLRGVIPRMLETPECGLSGSIASTPNDSAGPPSDDSMIKYWFPVLFSFYDIIMNGEDLEVRRL